MELDQRVFQLLWIAFFSAAKFHLPRLNPGGSDTVVFRPGKVQLWDLQKLGSCLTKPAQKRLWRYLEVVFKVLLLPWQPGTLSTFALDV